MHHYVDGIAKQGFAIVENVIDKEMVSKILQALASTRVEHVESRRAGKAFGIRNLLNVVPLTRDLAHSAACKSFVESILGSSARVVRGIYFDKHRDANWKVAWHQDLTIAVKERIEVDSYGPWSIKAGIHHVQPPVSILENMLTVRLHLDDTDDANGALRVIPGTHQYGRLDANQIDYWKQQQQPSTCVVRSGGALVMRPLLLHSSMAAVNPEHRRVLHFEYSAQDLRSGLRWFEEQ